MGHGDHAPAPRRDRVLRELRLPVLHRPRRHPAHPGTRRVHPAPGRHGHRRRACSARPCRRVHRGHFGHGRRGGGAHAYLDFALAEPELYQLMYGLGGVRVSATDAWNEGQDVGDLLAGLLITAGDTRPEQHVLQLWAMAHGLIALLVVGRVSVADDGLNALLEDALTDCLIRARPAALAPGTTPDSRQGRPQSS
ncbi:TetR-like C-terminal domain-containing protein [Streptomyces mirabilis]